MSLENSNYRGLVRLRQDRDVANVAFECEIASAILDPSKCPNHLAQDVERRYKSPIAMGPPHCGSQFTDSDLAGNCDDSTCPLPEWFAVKILQRKPNAIGTDLMQIG